MDTPARSIEERQKLFAMKNKMIDIPNNFPKSDIKTRCFCGMIEDMNHIYECELFNTKNQTNILPYDKIYSGNINEQIRVFRKMENNLEKREDMKKHESPCDPDVIRCIPYIVVLD